MSESYAAFVKQMARQVVSIELILHPEWKLQEGKVIVTLMANGLMNLTI
ncbi:MAG TPA: hypothetical protein VFG45_04300 [Candidatus Nitrosocosmicus sp.]|jgi:hypothetical protein|nr:hypothetical protein [Candidatus Nitrosocosmicus sp.]